MTRSPLWIVVVAGAVFGAPSLAFGDDPPAPAAKVAAPTPPKVVPTRIIAKPVKPVELGGDTPLAVTVTGAGAGSPVTWQVAGEGNGSVDDQGVFHAPKTHATPARISVTASVAGDSPASAKLTVALLPVSVVIQAVGKSLQVGEAIDLAAEVKGASGEAGAITWSATGSGTIDDKGHLTIPSTLKTPGTVTVKATSVGDPSKSASVAVGIAAIAVSAKPVHPVALGESVDLSASLTGASGDGAKVTWSVPDGQGTIDGNGHYTAPEHAKTPMTVAAKATSVADPSKGASVAIAIPAVSVSVAPAAPTVSVGGTVTFEGKENGKAVPLTWTLEGGKDQGDLDAQGKYTAPATFHTPGRVVVKATSVVDPSKSASATITIPAIAVIAKPVHPVQLGESVDLSASVTGASGDGAKITWSVPDGQGTIDANGHFTAPAAYKTPATIIAKVTSVADPSKGASVPIAIPPIVVTVSPAAPTVAVGGTVTFEGKENGKPGSLTWTLEGGKDQGDLDAQGKYTAPATFHTPGHLVVKATSVADPSKSASATITIPAIAVIAKPVHPVQLGESVDLSASVTGASGDGAKITWSVPDGQGTIDANGHFTAPAAYKTPATIIAKVTSVADPSKGASVSIAIPPIVVTVSPVAPTVPVGGSVTFEGKENGKPGSLTWTLEGGQDQGELDAQGKYTAPSTFHTPGRVVVKATSVADPSRSATATIAIPAISVVAKAAKPVILGESADLGASLTGASGDAAKLTWSVPDGQGSIDGAGHFTAPSTYKTPATIIAKVSSVADPSKGASVSIAIPAVTVGVSPAAATVELGGSTSFTGTENGKPASLTWSVGKDQGEIDAQGKYSPPAQLKTPAHVVIRGTSTSDPSKSASAAISIPALSLSLSSKALTVQLGSSAKVEAKVVHAEGDAAKVTWSVTGGEANGTIDADGTFHAPQVKPASATTVIKAVSVADPAQGASAEVHWVPVIVKVTPEHIRAALGGTLHFDAHVEGAAETGVDWSVAGTNAGSIAADGTYTAPPEPPSPTAVKIVARAKADPSRAVTVIADVVGKPEVRSFAPASAGIGEVLTVEGVHFAERGTGSQVLVGGVEAADSDYVSWGASAIAVKVPAGAKSGKVEVHALGGSSESSSDFTVLRAAIALEPTALLVRQGERAQFHARVSHAGDARVTWTLEGDTDAAKLYGDGTLVAADALSAIRHVVVRATSAADPAQSATAEVVLGSQGIVVWQSAAEGAHGPTTDGNGHYFITTRDGTVQAFDASGKQLWHVTIVEPPLAGEVADQLRTPVAAGDLVVTVVQSTGTCLNGRACQPDTASLIALHAADGTPAWKQALGDGDFTDVVAIPGAVAVARYTGAVAAYASHDGKLKWIAQTAKGLLTAPVLGPDGLLHGSGEHGSVYALSQEGKVAFTIELPEKPENVSRPAVSADGTSYVVGDDAALRAIDPHGRVLWKSALGGRVPPRTDPMPLLGANGLLVAASGSTLESFSTAGVRQWSTPCAACSAPLTQGSDGHIYAGRHSPQSYDTNGNLAWAGEAAGDSDRWTPGVLTPDGYLLWTDAHGLSARLTTGGSPPAAPDPAPAAKPTTKPKAGKSHAAH